MSPVQQSRTLSLLLGTIAMISAMAAAIVVAWAGVMWGPAQSSHFDASVQPDDPRGTEFRAYFPPGEAGYDSYGAHTSIGCAWISETIIASRSGRSRTHPDNKNSLRRVAAGWPMYCVEAREITTASGSRWESALPNPLATRPQLAVMPYCPVWPGLAVNSVIFLGVQAAGVLGFIVARRLYRRARGRCSRCGYDLRGRNSTICPECGSNQTLT